METRTIAAKYPAFEEGEKVFPTLCEVVKGGDLISMLIDGLSMKIGRSCRNHTFSLGKTYDFHFINLTPDSHPIHFHLINFQRVKTYKIDVHSYKLKYF